MESEIRTCKVRLRGVSPYSASRHYALEHPKKDKETHDVHEKRTWKNRLHVNSVGNVVIPGMAFKLAMENAGKYLAIKIPGQGNKTWTKRFICGLLVANDMDLGLKSDEVKGEWRFVPADGKRGGSKRVMKCFPVLPEWEGEIEFIILDPMIEREVFEKHLVEAGKYVGVGRFRPDNGGFYGRFEVISFNWE